jgi:hypothetical protein
VPIGRCPFTDEVAYKRIDIFGLDGPFWRVTAPDQPAVGGQHFITYQGALNLKGQTPIGAAPNNADEIRPGPEVPFVIPRLLNLPGVVCVISSRPIVNDRFTAYFMAYYAKKPVPADESHQEWLRTSLYYTDAAGNSAWTVKNDVWDFDLQPWRHKDKLWWIAPEDGSLTLRKGHDPAFPFLQVAGQKQPCVIRQGKVYPAALPDGEPIDPGD